ncbi:hypothetical protein PGB90_005087 [Kerria lacca]
MATSQGNTYGKLHCSFYRDTPVGPGGKPEPQGFPTLQSHPHGIVSVVDYAGSLTHSIPLGLRGKPSYSGRRKDSGLSPFLTNNRT